MFKERNDCLVKEKESAKSDKITLQLWMKIVLLIVLFFIVIILYSLILANITDFQAKQQRTLPQVPFTTTKSFCPLSESVHNVEYEKGGLLIISKPENYVVGDKILIQNRYADKKKYSINKSYVLGVISEINGEEYVANLFSFEKQPLTIKASEIAGKVDKYYAFIGGIYNNLVGIKGYVLFGAIPILVFCLLYFIFRLVCIDKKSRELQAESESTANSVGNLEYIEQETEVEWVIPSKEQIHEEEEQEMKPMLLHTDESAIAEQKKTTIINDKKANNNPEIKTENEQPSVLEQTEVALEPAIPPVMEPSYDKPLSADEIIAIYREKKQSQQHVQSKPFEKIARMYYDNNIENYD
jgi:hypothetical protein